MTSQPSQRSQPCQTGSGERRLAWRLTWLAVAKGILRSRRFQDQVIVGAIVLAALAGLRKKQAAPSRASSPRPGGSIGEPSARSKRRSAVQAVGPG
jgi:hypothetical protein